MADNSSGGMMAIVAIIAVIALVGIAYVFMQNSPAANPGSSNPSVNIDVPLGGEGNGQ